jgi:hypothetical protein
MAKVKTEGVDLVAAIEAAGEQDMEAIDERIAALRQEICGYVATRKRKLAALMLVRRSLQFKLHGKPAKAPKGERSTVGSELATQIYDLIAEHGSLPVPAIAARLGRPGQAIADSIQRSAWFERKNGEVHIAKTK